jgi:intracellular septation protein
MKFLFDFFPIVLFFIIFKFFGIYAATGTAMLTSALQVLYIKYKYHTVEKMHILNLAIIIVLGGATLVFHDPLFIKWKPTGIYWITSLVFLGYSILNKKTPIQNMMEKDIQLPINIWKKINNLWILFFFFMGLANIYVAYNYSTQTWVNFKLFGGLGFTIFFILGQGLYISQFISKNNIKSAS